MAASVSRPFLGLGGFPAQSSLSSCPQLAQHAWQSFASKMILRMTQITQESLPKRMRLAIRAQERSWSQCLTCQLLLFPRFGVRGYTMANLGFHFLFDEAICHRWSLGRRGESGEIIRPRSAQLLSGTPWVWACCPMPCMHDAAIRSHRSSRSLALLRPPTESAVGFACTVCGRREALLQHPSWETSEGYRQLPAAPRDLLVVPHVEVVIAASRIVQLLTL